MWLFSHTDINKLNEKISDLLFESKKKSSIFLNPNIDEFNKIAKTILKYVKSKNRIIYGGYGLHLLLKKIRNEILYDEYDIHDIEFYSDNPVGDIKYLCNKLYKKKFKYVIGQEAEHEETFTLFVNIQKICDIWYMPKNIYDKIRYIIIDDIKIVDPIFMLIDKFRMFTNFLTFWR